MLPQEGTRVKIVTELKDSDDVHVMAKAGDIAQVTCAFDDYVLVRLVAGNKEFVAYSDEYEVLS